MTTRSRTPQLVGVFFAGILFLQAAWILALPPYRGIDEFDHAYRAAAVARGEWTAGEPVESGRGLLVSVPKDIVNAAHPVCVSYTHTGPDNCRGVRTLPDGRVLVGSGAGLYNPTYYAFVGQVAKVLHGDAAVMGMRIVSALVCAVFLAWGAGLMLRWGDTRWPLVAYIAGVTPMLLYLSTNVNPSALTTAGAVLMWTAAIGALRSGSLRGHAAALSIAAFTLVTTHTLGLLWLATTAVVLLVLAGPRRWAQVARTDTPRTVAVLSVIAATTIASLAWILHARTNMLSQAEPLTATPPHASFLVLEVRWILQSIGAFPTRSDAAPTVTYALWVALLAGIAVTLVRAGTRHELLATGLIVVFALGIPVMFTLMSEATIGQAWQGRYALPLWAGITTIAATTLTRRARPPKPAVLTFTFIAVGASNAVAAVHVARTSDMNGAKMPPVHGLPGGEGVLVVLTVLGALLLIAGLATQDRARSATVSSRATEASA